MTISEINGKVNQLAGAWENFKQVNERKLEEFAKKNASDPLLDEQLRRINEHLDEQKARLDFIETKNARPAFASDAKSFDPHSKAFSNYVRKGMEAELQAMESKSLFAGSDSEGGFLVTPAMSKQISQRIFESSPIRQLCSSEMISSSSLEFVEDADDVGAGWAEELDAREETQTPTLRKRKIEVNEIYAQPKATQKLIDDSFINIEQWLVSKIADKFSRIENEAFINGDGVGKPFGLLAQNSQAGQIETLESDKAGSVTVDALMTLSLSLKEQYLSRAAFLMNRKLLQEIRALKDPATGAYLWNPGLAHKSFDTLLGLPIYTCSEMPSGNSGKAAVILADFKQAYKIVDRSGIRVMRDPYTEKPFVKFYVTKRVGADLLTPEAAKILKI